MPDAQTNEIDDVLELLICEGPNGMAAAFARLFNLAMRIERENFLGARHYERSQNRRGYAKRQAQADRHAGRNGDGGGSQDGGRR